MLNLGRACRHTACAAVHLATTGLTTVLSCTTPSFGTVQQYSSGLVSLAYSSATPLFNQSGPYLLRCCAAQPPPRPASRPGLVSPLHGLTARSTPQVKTCLTVCPAGYEHCARTHNLQDRALATLAQSATRTSVLSPGIFVANLQYLRSGWCC